MVYIETNAEPRTNTSFRERWDPEYHNGETILEQLNIDMVVDFPYDPMHQLYLGVTKSWASYVVTDREFKISDDAGKLMNKFISLLKSSTPRELGRKVRTFEYIAKFKATEWRTFLLYTGPVIMKNRLSSDRFNHFMTLHVAMKLLSYESWCYAYNDFAKQLLKNFVENARIIYGRHFLTYNVHSLINFADDVKRFDPLDRYSAFPFKNKLGILKRMLRKYDLPMQQIVKRIHESQCQNSETFFYKCHR